MCYYCVWNVKKSFIYFLFGMCFDFFIKLENKNCGERNIYDGDLVFCDFVLEIMNQMFKFYVN